MTFPNLSPTDVGLIVAVGGKVFIEIADAMPQPEPSANYFVRWFYAFMQKLASNGMKAEAIRAGVTLPAVGTPEAKP